MVTGSFGVCAEDEGEECDDGNDLVGDGCSVACLAEITGNDFDEGEACDDGSGWTRRVCRSSEGALRHQLYRRGGCGDGNRRAITAARWNGAAVTGASRAAKLATVTLSQAMAAMARSLQQRSCRREAAMTAARKPVTAATMAA